jgi:hypothetical protein
MYRNRNVALAAVLSIAVASCADAQRTAHPPTVLDSAGIRIVTNVLPTNVAATIASSPTLDIGGGDDAAGALAGVMGAVRLGDGRVAIAEQSTRSIKLFDAKGRFVRTIGRQGAGPGEFTSLVRLDLLPGDSLAAYDGLRATLTVFDTIGRVGRTERLPAGPGGLSLNGVLGDGTMVLSRAYNVMFSRTSRPERDPITYVAVRPQSRVVDTIADVAGTDMFLFAGEDFSSRRELPFGRTSVIAVGRDRLYFGTGDRWQIDARTSDGQVVGVYRLRHEPTKVTESEIARFKREFIERMKGTRVQATGGGGGGPADMRARMIAQSERMLEVVPFPETHAPYDSLLIGADGELWVRRAHPFPSEASTWTILAHGGAALGLVTLPAEMRPLHIGRDFLVALTKDADDVQHVGVYAVKRAPGGAAP